MTAPDLRTLRTLFAATVVGVIGWLGVIAIGRQLGSVSPSAVGFDLELLLAAGRAVAAGRSPYGVDLVAGAAPTATDLFYSYPPPVAQILSLVAGIPSSVMLVIWAFGAVAGLLGVAELLRRRLSPDRPAIVVLAVVAAVAPLTLPFIVGLLFGNLDVYFPVLYGLMLAAVIDESRAAAVSGGIALVLASLKIHPASMGLWFLVRWVRERATTTRLVLLSAAGAALVVVAVSAIVGGIGPWTEYADVVRSGTGARIVDPRNAGFAALLASSSGQSDAFARLLHVVVAAGAVGVTIWAAWRRGDPIEAFAWATAASLATLPVTWYHYPSAMMPIGIAAWLRADGNGTRKVVACLIVAEVLAAAALVVLPLLWVAMGLVILAARWSRLGVTTASVPGAG